MNAINVKSMGGANLCATKRKRKLDIKSPQNPAFERNGIIKLIIKGFKYLPSRYATVDNAVDDVPRIMKDVSAICEITRENQVAEMQALIKRYLEADDRQCREPITKIFKFNGKQYLIKPDFVFEKKTALKKKHSKNPLDVEMVPEIEVVVLSTGRTTMTNSNKGRSMDTAIKYSPVALGMLLYGLSILGSRRGIVKITFDSLKSAIDKNGDYSKPWSVAAIAGSTKNNHSVSEVYYFKNKKLFRHYGLTGMDVFKNYQESIGKYEQSEECSKTECKKCDLYQICNYNKPPKAKDEEVIEKKISDFSITAEQQKVIDAYDGVFRVIAGPGSGKTFCVTQRILNLVLNGAMPKRILMTTFSRSGVAEMQSRIKQLFEEYGITADPNDITISTFNGLGNELIKKYYQELGYTEQPELLDDVEEKMIISEILQDSTVQIEGLDYRNPTLRFGGKGGPKGVVTYLYDTFNEIRSKNCETIDDFKQKVGLEDSRTLTDESYEEIWKLYKRFEHLIQERNFIDYTDQSNLVLKLMQMEEETGISYISDTFEFEHIIVDEFQDSNDFQMEFIQQLMATPYFISLMVVGDDSQAIYGFRGTSPKNIINMDKMMECQTKDFFITQTHRFPQPIADVANDIIMKNQERVDKMIVSVEKAGKKPQFKAFEKESAEHAYIANCIQKLVEEGEEPSDIAVISHKKSTLSKIGKELTKRNILGLKNSEKLLDNSKVNAAISLAEFFQDPDATASLLVYLDAVYDNQVLDMQDEDINELLNVNQQDFVNYYMPAEPTIKKEYFLSLLNLLDDQTDDSYTAFLEKIAQKTRYDIFSLLNYILKFKQYDSEDEAQRKGTYNAVELTTAHASKGKEWKYVFVTVSDFLRFNTQWSELEEKRRLLFVAVTRARKELVVTTVREITSDNNLDSKRIHRFYQEMRTMDSFDLDV